MTRHGTRSGPVPRGRGVRPGTGPDGVGPDRTEPGGVEPGEATLSEAAPGDGEPAGDVGGSHRVVCHLDRLLAERGMTLTELAQRAGVTVVNLSVLKNDRARAVRFSTLTAVCDTLGCQPGDLLSVAPAPGVPPR